ETFAQRGEYEALGLLIRHVNSRVGNEPREEHILEIRIREPLCAQIGFDARASHHERQLAAGATIAAPGAQQALVIAARIEWLSRMSAVNDPRHRQNEALR